MITGYTLDWGMADESPTPTPTDYNALAEQVISRYRSEVCNVGSSTKSRTRSLPQRSLNSIQ